MDTATASTAAATSARLVQAGGREREREMGALHEYDNEYDSQWYKLAADADAGASNTSTSSAAQGRGERDAEREREKERETREVAETAAALGEVKSVCFAGDSAIAVLTEACLLL